MSDLIFLFIVCISPLVVIFFNTQLVKRQLTEHANTTDDKLDDIHVLVNSDMTKALRSELNATERELVLMKKLIYVENGMNPTDIQIDQVMSTEVLISELKAKLTDRLSQSDILTAQVAAREAYNV